MSTITARIPNDLNEALSAIAKTMERPKTFIIHKAIEQYIKDIEDAEIALERMKEPNRKFYSSDQMKEILDNRYHAEKNL